MNKQQISEYNAKYYKANKDDRLKYAKKHRAANPEQIKKTNKENYHRMKAIAPWMISYKRAQTRTLYDKNSSYYKCVEFNITPDEIKEVYFRDKAYMLTKASIDRKDNNRGYVKDNIQFIELQDNIRKTRRSKVRSGVNV